MSRKFIVNALLVSVTVAICLGMIEVGLRGYRKFTQRYSAEAAQTKAQSWVRSKSEDAFDREDAYFGKWDQFAKMRYSGYLGYWPASHYVGKGYRTNNVGFRNDADIAVEKAPDERRIFVVGGSTAWGAGVLQEDTYARFLESRLSNALPGQKVTVWIAAVGAYLTTHERIVVTNKLAALSPDAIVHLSGWNDTYAGYRGFSVMDDRWDYTASASILGQYHNLFVYDEDSAMMTDPGPPTKNDHTLALFHFADQIYYAKRLEQTRRPTQNVVDDLITNIRLAKASVPANVAYLFALQPTIYATDKKLTTWETALLDKNQAATPAFGDYNREVYALYRNQLEPKLGAMGIGVIDTDASISKEARSVFTDHVHLGDRGNRMLGEYLASALAKMLQAP